MIESGDGFLSSCAFCGKGAPPQRSGIDPVGIEGEHPVVEVASLDGDIANRRTAIWFQGKVAALDNE